MLDAVGRLGREHALNFALPASATTGAEFFRERIGKAPIRVIEGESWDAIAHASVALAASGTVTVEAALLGAPMVTFYKVTAPSWLLGKMLVDVPFYSMVNLIAGRAVVPELMQGQMTGARIAAEASRLLADGPRAGKCKPGWRKYAKSFRAVAMRQAAPPPSFKKFWKDKPHMFRDPPHRRFSRVAPIPAALAFFAGRFAAQTPEHRNRIDVQDYTIKADISPNTQTISAQPPCASSRWTMGSPPPFSS